MAENRIDTIPNFVKAESLSGLRRAMLKNNVRLGAFVLYGNISQITDGDKRYYIAWYNEPMSDLTKVGNNEPTK